MIHIVKKFNTDEIFIYQGNSVNKGYWLTFVFFAICASLGGIPETSREVLNISLE